MTRKMLIGTCGRGQNPRGGIFLCRIEGWRASNEGWTQAVVDLPEMGKVVASDRSSSHLGRSNCVDISLNFTRAAAQVACCQ